MQRGDMPVLNIRNLQFANGRDNIVVDEIMVLSAGSRFKLSFHMFGEKDFKGCFHQRNGFAFSDFLSRVSPQSNGSGFLFRNGAGLFNGNGGEGTKS